MAVELLRRGVVLFISLFISKAKQRFTGGNRVPAGESLQGS